MGASDLCSFFDSLFRTGRASAGPPVGTLDSADPGLTDLDRVLVARVDWHIRGLPGSAQGLAADVAVARACAHAIYEFLSVSIESADERLRGLPGLVDAVASPASPDAVVTLDALLLDGPRMRKRFEAAAPPQGPACVSSLDRLVMKSPMTLLRFTGTCWAPPSDFVPIVGSRPLEEEAVALLAFPGPDADRLRALGQSLTALLGAGGPQTHLALRAYEVFSFFCARTVTREPPGGARHALDVRGLARGGALGPDERAIAEYLKPLGIVAQSPRLADVMEQHPRLSRELVDAARDAIGKFDPAFAP
jgi:hypothetical protein